MSREWVNDAIRKIEADAHRSSDTHLYPLPIPGVPDIHLYFKDESSHPTGSLKHRLARSLFLYGLANNWIDEGRPIVEASSGSTAVSEAYFARFLGLDFYAVMPRSTSREKIREITRLGGRCHFVDRSDSVYSEAERLAAELGGHYLDQFTYAERATDWRGNNNIAESIFAQLALEPHPVPAWVVCGAGTGGTSATIGRYLRYRRLDCRLCVADPENSIYNDYFASGDATLTLPTASRIEGIGRPRVEPSFIRTVIDRMEKVPDVASMAAIWFLGDRLGHSCGASTGTNLIAAVRLIAEMRAAGQEGSVVTLLCDSGTRYGDTCFNRDWLDERGLAIDPWVEALEFFHATGVWHEPA